MFTIIILILSIVGIISCSYGWWYTNNQCEYFEKENIEYRKGKMFETKLGFQLWGAGSVLVFSVIILCGGTYSFNLGEAVIVTKFGQVYETNFNANGVHCKRPWADVIVWNIRANIINDLIEGHTEKGELVSIVYMYSWGINHDKLIPLYTTIAENIDSLKKYIVPEIDASIREVIAKNNYGELFINREKYAREIKEIISKKLSDSYVVSNKFIITDIILQKENISQEKESE